jgi:oligopeptide/dipeptide ABC transporter ATP-binding protein
MREAVLQVEGLKVHFPVKKGLVKRVVGQVKAVDGVSFTIGRGETLGLVGESGCGKTTIGRAIVKLTPITQGRVIYKGCDITAFGVRQMRPLRSAVQMIFQDPFSSLNPRMTVGDIIAEPIKFHRPRADYQQEALRLMALTGLRPDYLKRYPHQFSGGQRQRIGIARALACEPELVIADEPVSALDVSIQAQIINLLKGLQKQLGLAYLFIAHDLAVVKHISHRVAVMYLGAIMEASPADQLYRRPLHPYTRALMASVPVSDPRLRGEMRGLEGEMPSPLNAPPGCRFQTRCPYARDICRAAAPAAELAEENHLVACHRWRQVQEKG